MDTNHVPKSTDPVVQPCPPQVPQAPVPQQDHVLLALVDSGVLLSDADQAAMDHASTPDLGADFQDDSGPQSASPSSSDPAPVGGTGFLH